MYTIMVVDDEAIVCQSIKELLEQADLPVSQVLTACNGYEALDYLRMETVDLVLTDIQMDGMSGIELMESILSEQPNIPVVVISAHDEFEYAQKCIRLGARDYLIKPVLLEHLTSVVKRELAKRHEKYKLLLEDSLKLKFSMSGMASLRTYILNEMLAGPLAHTDDYEFIFEQIGVQLHGPEFAIAVIDLLWGNKAFSLRDRNLLKYATVNIAEETLKDLNAVAYYGQGNRIHIILQLKDPEQSLTRTERMTKLNVMGKALSENVSDYLNLDAIVGISPFKHGLSSLADCYAAASDAAKWHGLYGNQRVFYSEDFTLREAQVKVNWQEKTNLLAQWLEVGRKGDEGEEPIYAFMEEMAPVFETGDSTAGIPLSVAYRVYSLLLDMQTIVGDGYKALDPLTYFKFPMSGPELKKRMTDYLFEAARLIRVAMSNQDQAFVTKAAAYIRSHYQDKGLKIQDIAEEVHLSPNYLSSLFKLVTDETVWDYVTRLRMEGAMQLLMHTQKKRYEIADEVGYESPEHFSRVFKRYFGQSPSAVRG